MGVESGAPVRPDTHPLFVTGPSTAHCSLARGEGHDGQGEGKSPKAPCSVLAMIASHRPVTTSNCFRLHPGRGSPLLIPTTLY